ncbi:hypothetical protein EBB06_12530 [Crenobacter cavernae]|uniref:Uncharacterized protein n=2 Tax=Crenobacter cavernae TaxID=2290923 RepID=A0ABY0FDT8_9NEIS|nr:hypothetical protein EBB06_12530 [Crenobacter cavernae]
MAGNIVNGSAIYDVFWARMDWMLGRRGDWMDCKVADQRVKTGAAWGTNEALCNSFNITDKAPSENDRVIPMKS